MRVLFSAVLVACLSRQATGTEQLQAISASQSSTLLYSGVKYPAGRAIDGDFSTQAHTICSGNEIWLKVNFEITSCFDFVRIVQHNLAIIYAQRMDGAKVYVAESETGEEQICGTIEISTISTVAGQTYDISCREEGLLCGNQIVIRQLRTIEHTGCIHVTEVQAFGTRLIGKQVLNRLLCASLKLRDYSFVRTELLLPLSFWLHHHDNSEILKKCRQFLLLTFILFNIFLIIWVNY